VRLEDGALSAELRALDDLQLGAGKAPRTRSRRERIRREEGGLYLSLIASSRERGLAAGGRCRPAGCPVDAPAHAACPPEVPLAPAQVAGRRRHPQRSE